MRGDGDKTSRAPAIEDHGVIGDLRTVALVASDGTLDWLCWPHFDSPSVFASLLDADKGGHFRIHPVHDGERVVHKQFYWPETNVLVTRFYSEDGVGELVDFMPRGGAGDAARGGAPHPRGARAHGLRDGVPPRLQLRAGTRTR